MEEARRKLEEKRRLDTALRELAATFLLALREYRQWPIRNGNALDDPDTSSPGPLIQAESWKVTSILLPLELVASKAIYDTADK